MEEPKMVNRNRIGKIINPPLAQYGSVIPAVLTNSESAADDETGTAVRIEQTRYERAVLDFESEIRRRRDAMHSEHLMLMRAALNGEAAE
jgi:hypothetical protein